MTISKLEWLGDSVIPRRYRPILEQYLQRASIRKVPYRAYGWTLCIVIAFSVLLYVGLCFTSFFANASLVIKIVAGILVIPVIIATIIGTLILIYGVYLEARIYFKVRQMEEAFPEFLSELSLNLKSGQGLAESIENSLEKEFGPLSEEMERVAGKVRLGMEIEDALKEFTQGYDSDVMEESFQLIMTSWKKGADTSQLVERLYENLGVVRYLRRKVIASVTSYRIFLSTVTLVIAPAMFALSYHLLDLIKTITGKITAMSTGVAMPIAVNAVRIDIEEFRLFSILALMIMSAFTAFIISIIKTGSIKEGYKQVILFAAGTYASYSLAMLVFRYFFGMFNV